MARKPKSEAATETAMEFAVTMGMDAFRVCIGMKPRTHKPEDIFRWMRAMAKSSLQIGT